VIGIVGIRTLTGAVRGLAKTSPARAAKGRRLLSLSEAARQLGVSRNKTLHQWIRDRRIKIVTVEGRQKVPVAEVERLSAEGMGPAGRHAERRY